MSGPDSVYNEQNSYVKTALLSLSLCLTFSLPPGPPPISLNCMAKISWEAENCKRMRDGDAAVEAEEFLLEINLKQSRVNLERAFGSATSTRWISFSLIHLTHSKHGAIISLILNTQKSGFRDK